MTKRYYSVNGEILGDSSSGYYMRDALGSVTGTIPNKVVANTYRYKPYGERLAKTGTAPDPCIWTCEKNFGCDKCGSDAQCHIECIYNCCRENMEALWNCKKL